MRIRTTRTVVALAAVAVMVIAGCGSSDKKDDVASGSGGSLSQMAGLSGKVNDKGSKTVTGSSASVDVDLEDFAFSPTFMKVDAGAKVTVNLKNTGKAPHTFTVDGTDVDTQVAPGKTGTATVTAPKSGVVAYFCKFHKGQGMQGAAVVSAATGASGGAGSDQPTTTADSGGGGYGY
jgi:plastocyanin